MNFTLRQIRYFVAVAERGSVSAAAHELSISQSTVTESLRDLEHQLGFRLLERRGRGVALSDKGHQFLRHANRIMAEVSNVSRALGEDPVPGAGSLNLGVTSIVAGYVLSDLLARYRRAFPGVAVSVIEDAPEFLEHLLVNGELDLAVMIVGGPTATTALQAETLEHSAFRLWMPASHPLTATAEVGLGDLAGEALVQLMADEIEGALRPVLARISPRPRLAFRTRSVEAVRSLVATGAGLALLPDLVYRPWSLEGDRIEARPLTPPSPAVRIGTAWRRGSTLSTAATRFVELARLARMPRGR